MSSWVAQRSKINSWTTWFRTHWRLIGRPSGATMAVVMVYSVIGKNHDEAYLHQWLSKQVHLDSHKLKEWNSSLAQFSKHDLQREVATCSKVKWGHFRQIKIFQSKRSTWGQVEDSSFLNTYISFWKWLLPLIMPFTFDINHQNWHLELLSPSNRWAKLRERQPLKP